ncbi:nitrite reductase small subunit NirD [Oceanobacter kriegii]|uniref:nitrite reductase small subunit NirD n=1 Tax=Oceanobacter kriegii TaxID=64972 RepID=UPI00040E7282|nr:nitrite reductase small subunit NirD [Oceanobacter kriegii]
MTNVCALTDIAPDTGVCALHEGEQVALFRIGNTEQVFAVSNYDPFGKANVMSRGLIGTKGDRYMVASPLYKQHYDLATGECFEDENIKLKTWTVQVKDGRVELV